MPGLQDNRTQVVVVVCVLFVGAFYLLSSSSSSSSAAVGGSSWGSAGGSGTATKQRATQGPGPAGAELGGSETPGFFPAPAQDSEGACTDDYTCRLPVVRRALKRFQEVVDAAAPGGRAGVIGNIGWHTQQVFYYFKFIMNPTVKTVCEIGLGAGHSAVIFLAARPDVKVYMFDLFPTATTEKSMGREVVNGQSGFQHAALQWIEEQFPGRLIKIPGSSDVSVPAFVTANPKMRCDLMSIDGSHTPPQPYRDILHFAPLAAKRSQPVVKGQQRPVPTGTVVVLDDMQDLKGDLDRAAAEGVAMIHECLRGEDFTDTEHTATAYYPGKVFCSMSYLSTAPHRPQPTLAAP